jgi:hypothetical protein
LYLSPAMMNAWCWLQGSSSSSSSSTSVKARWCCCWCSELRHLRLLPCCCWWVCCHLPLLSTPALAHPVLCMQTLWHELPSPLLLVFTMSHVMQ